MKVKKLIEQLNKYDPEAVVRMHERYGSPVLFALALQNDHTTVWLECEEDTDMAEEIKVRFQQALESEQDELDFYTDLLETGIDVDMVCRYLDDDTADHMETFCKDHGLL